MNRIFKTAPNAFGLEISGQGVKIAQISRQGKNHILDVADSVAYSEGVFMDGEIRNPAVVKEAITSLLKKHQGKLVSGVVTCLSESQTFMQSLQINKEPGKKFDQRLIETLPEYLPLVLEEAYYDAQIVTDKPTAWQVCAGAASKKQVDSYLDIIRQLNLIPLAIDLEAGAITRAILKDAQPEPAVAILDLGSSHASMIIIERGTIQFTISMPVAGRAITKHIATTLNISEEQAEKAKQTCGLHADKCDGVVLHILEDMVRDLTKHMADAQQYYENHFTDASSIKEIVLCGGGAALPNLAPTLETASKIPVQIINPFDGISSPDFFANPNHGLSFTTVCGLALRGQTATL